MLNTATQTNGPAKGWASISPEAVVGLSADHIKRTKVQHYEELILRIEYSLVAPGSGQISPTVDTSKAQLIGTINARQWGDCDGS